MEGKYVISSDCTFQWKVAGFKRDATITIFNLKQGKVQCIHLAAGVRHPKTPSSSLYLPSSSQQRFPDDKKAGKK